MNETIRQLVWIAAPSVFAGAIQGVTGFGYGMLIMLFLPMVFSMQQASAISQCLSVILCASMFGKYRKEASLRRIALPLAFYLPVFFVSLSISAVLKADVLKPALGLFLIGMAVYMILFSGRITIKAGAGAAFVCGSIAAVGDAFFAIGGPPMVMYFLSTIEDKKEYLGTIQAFSVACSLYGVIMRVAKGQITLSLLPLLAVGIAAQQAGLVLGGKIVDRIQPEAMKRAVYGLIGTAGLITFILNI